MPVKLFHPRIEASVAPSGELFCSLNADAQSHGRVRAGDLFAWNAGLWCITGIDRASIGDSKCRGIELVFMSSGTPHHTVSVYVKRASEVPSAGRFPGDVQRTGAETVLELLQWLAAAESGGGHLEGHAARLLAHYRPAVDWVRAQTGAMSPGPERIGGLLSPDDSDPDEGGEE